MIVNEWWYAAIGLSAFASLCAICEFTNGVLRRFGVDRGPGGNQRWLWCQSFVIAAALSTASIAGRLIAEPTAPIAAAAEWRAGVY